MRKRWLIIGLLLLSKWAFGQCVPEDFQSGFGVYLYKNGSKYEGELLNGLPNGEGTWTMPDHTVIKGTFVNGKPIRIEVQSNTVLTGCVSGDCINGIGEYIDDEGNRYVGHFRNGKFDGKGTCFYADKSKYDGYWKNGMPQGKGLFIQNNKLFRGIWKEGKLTTPADVYGQAVIDRSVKNVYAVVVGINNYHKNAMPPLRYAENDAGNFFNFLTGVRKISPLNIRFLTDKEASSDTIVNALAQAARKAMPGDEIVFFYSGHGIANALIPYDSDGKDNLLEYARLQKILAGTRAKKVSFFFDSCNNFPDDMSLQGFKPAPGFTAFLSSSPGQKSNEYSEMEEGLFTHFLLEGLEHGKADSNLDGIVTYRELLYYTTSEIGGISNTPQTPMLIQYNPYDDGALAVNPAGKAKF